jgi:hypothetical protein
MATSVWWYSHHHSAGCKLGVALWWPAAVVAVQELLPQHDSEIARLVDVTQLQVCFQCVVNFLHQVFNRRWLLLLTLNSRAGNASVPLLCNLHAQ